MTRISTLSGYSFNYLDPDPATICLKDIAVALSRTCRFGGHSREFYSVAAHCLAMVRLARTPRMRLHMLLHDAAEAYVGDVPRPLKNLLTNFEEIENRALEAVYRSLNVAPPTEDEWAVVREVDLRMLATEQIRFFDTVVPAFEPYPGFPLLVGRLAEEEAADYVTAVRLNLFASNRPRP